MPNPAPRSRAGFSSRRSGRDTGCAAGLFSSFCRSERLATKGHKELKGGSFGASSVTAISIAQSIFPITSLCRKLKFGHKSAQLRSRDAKSQRTGRPECQKKVVMSFSSSDRDWVNRLRTGVQRLHALKCLTAFLRQVRSGGTVLPGKVFSSFGRSAHGSPGGKKVEGDRSSRRLGLAGSRACDLATLSRTQVHDCFRKRPVGPKGVRGFGLFSSFCHNAFRSAPSALLFAWVISSFCRKGALGRRSKAPGKRTASPRSRDGMEITTPLPGEDDPPAWGKRLFAK